MEVIAEAEKEAARAKATAENLNAFICSYQFGLSCKICPNFAASAKFAGRVNYCVHLFKSATPET